MKIQSTKDTVSFRCDKSKKAELIKLAEAKKLTEAELYRQMVDSFLYSEQQQVIDNATLTTKLDNILTYQKKLLEIILAYKANPSGEQGISSGEINTLLECLLASMPGATATAERYLTIFKEKKAQRGINP